MVKRKLLASVAMGPFLALLGGAEANAQQAAPAVAYPNFTLGAYGGSSSGYGYGQIEGTFAAPLGASFGTQFDGSVGSENGVFSGQGAAQVFWRNPSVALLGLYGEYSHLGDAFTPDGARLGAESELYLSQFTLSGIAGVNFDNNDSFFAQARAYYYLDNNTKLFAGYVLDDAGSLGQQVNAGAVGFEHLFPSGFSIFGEARAGDHDYRAAWAGFKFYLGGPVDNNKSLLGRDREDVAPVWRFVAEKKQKVASSTSATSTTGTSTTTTTTTTSTSTTSTTSTTTSTTTSSTTTELIQ